MLAPLSRALRQIPKSEAVDTVTGHREFGVGVQKINVAGKFDLPRIFVPLLSPKNRDTGPMDGG
jgi:hypothetical protein